MNLNLAHIGSRKHLKVAAKEKRALKMKDKKKESRDHYPILLKVNKKTETPSPRSPPPDVVIPLLERERQSARSFKDLDKNDTTKGITIVIKNKKDIENGNNTNAENTEGKVGNTNSPNKRNVRANGLRRSLRRRNSSCLLCGLGRHHRAKKSRKSLRDSEGDSLSIDSGNAYTYICSLYIFTILDFGNRKVAL